MKKIAILILNYNGNQDTVECLKSIKQLTSENIHLEVIVIDNNSKLDCEHEVKKTLQGVHYIKNKKNLGYAGGNNIGVKYALALAVDYLLLLNNDTIVDKNFLKYLLSVGESGEKIGIIVPKIYFARGYEYHKDRYSDKEKGKVFWYAGGIMDWRNIIGYHRGVDEVDKGQYDKVEEVELASGNCMLIKQSVFSDVGFLDERYFLYYEDCDFSMRVKKKSYTIMYQPKAIIWHKNAASAGGSGSSLQDYFITRNRMLFGTTYASLRAKIALVKESLCIVIKGRYWQKRGIVDYYVGRFYKGSYPLR